MVVEENRRPISQRERGWAKWLTRALVKSGVKIENKSLVEPLVMLKHFGPNAGDPRTV